MLAREKGAREMKDSREVRKKNPRKSHPSRQDSSVIFDDYIRKADSKQGFHPMEHFKYGELENPISSDFEFQTQEQHKELQSSDGNSSLKPSLVPEQTSSKSTGFDASPSNLQDSDSRFLDVMETALVDVHLTVKPSYRAANVPFVCLTSKFNGNAILGYPLEIGELNTTKETVLHQLAWRTSRRTPVCYVTNSLSSYISKNVQENGLLIEEQSLTKFLKNPKQEKAAFRTTCVPVELIFSRILTAVDQLQS